MPTLVFHNVYFFPDLTTAVAATAYHGEWADETAVAMCVRLDGWVKYYPARRWLDTPGHTGLTLRCCGSYTQGAAGGGAEQRRQGVLGSGQVCPNDGDVPALATHGLARDLLAHHI